MPADPLPGVALAPVLLAALVALAGCGTAPGNGSGAGTTPGDGPTATGLPGTADLRPDAAARVDATVTEVIDGDTVEIRYGNGTTDTVRLLGIDAPETGGGNDPGEFEGVPDTDAGAACLGRAADAATRFATDRLLGEGVTVVVDALGDRRDRYDRLLAYVVVDGRNVNYRLVAAGHARVYDAPFSLSERFYAAEDDARGDGRGLWACAEPVTATATGLVLVEIHADAAGNDHENRNDEYLVFANAGDAALDLSGWTVADAAGHRYAFPGGTTLDPDDRLTLHTGSGTDGGGDYYWGADSAVWNNGGDTVTVRNASGAVVLERSY